MRMEEIIKNGTEQNNTPETNNELLPAQAAQPAQAPQEAPAAQRRAVTGHTYGMVDIAVIAFCMAGIVATGLLSSSWARWIVIGLCLLALPSPAVIQKIKERRRLNRASILACFHKLGITPVIEGNVVRWTSQGKSNAMRIASGCQVQISREYPLQEDILGMFESAALITMDEVFSAKVKVNRAEGGTGSFVFYTELICPSAKELGMILPASANILDTAEERQSLHLGEIISAQNKPKKRIGFQY